MSRGSLFPSSSGLVPLGMLVLLGFCLAGSTMATSNHRQAPPPPSTSLVASGTTALQTLPKIILPAMRSLVGAPLRLLRQLALELIDFLRSHRFLEIYDMRFWQKIVAKLPERAATYWTTLVTMESQCTQRTLCDLADLASRRTPKWFQQIALIYLNTFSEVHPYYQVAIHGLTSHQCAALYTECDAEQFMERVRGNVTETIASTVAPMREAFNDLVTVTTSTISSLAENEVQDREPFKAQRNNNADFELDGASDDITNDQDDRVRGQVRGPVHDQFRDQVRGPVHEQFRDQVHDQIRMRNEDGRPASPNHHFAQAPPQHPFPMMQQHHQAAPMVPNAGSGPMAGPMHRNPFVPQHFPRH